MLVRRARSFVFQGTIPGSVCSSTKNLLRSQYPSGVIQWMPAIGAFQQPVPFAMQWPEHRIAFEPTRPC